MDERCIWTKKVTNDMDVEGVAGSLRLLQVEEVVGQDVVRKARSPSRETHDDFSLAAAERTKKKMPLVTVNPLGEASTTLDAVAA